jgi:hypothetical protein
MPSEDCNDFSKVVSFSIRRRKCQRRRTVIRNSLGEALWAGGEPRNRANTDVNDFNNALLGTPNSLKPINFNRSGKSYCVLHGTIHNALHCALRCVSALKCRRCLCQLDQERRCGRFGRAKGGSYILLLLLPFDLIREGLEKERPKRPRVAHPAQCPGGGPTTDYLVSSMFPRLRLPSRHRL